MKTNDIAFICDDNYCMPTAVCIQSIIDNYFQCDKLKIHVCSFGLATRNVERLKKMGNSDVEIIINLFDRKKVEDRLNIVSQRSHVTPTALIKFELPNYFKDLDSILYMDSDIVVKSDISELFQIDLSDYYLAASYEFFEYLKRIQYSLKRSLGKFFYFNSGIMLLNLRKMREENISEKLWDYKLNKAKTTLMDQESLNAICASKTLHLPIKWNFNPLFNNKSFVKYINKVYNSNYTALSDLIEDIKVIHYVGAKDKPWKYQNARMRDYWENCFERTPFACELNLSVSKAEERSFYRIIRDKIRENGLWGSLCYMIYRLEN